MKRLLVGAALLLGLALAFQGCRRAGGVNVEIKGSDTMVNLAQAWAEAYAGEHPNVDVTVTGGGSGTGIAALIGGDTDIAESSREMAEDELAQARRNGLNPQEFVVARDGVSMIVNPRNPVSRLTIGQLADIYTGRTANWKQLGGRDEKIVALSRDKSSGTHSFVLEHVLRGGDPKGTEEYAKSVLLLPSSQAIADEVASNEAAIGYVGMGYVAADKHKAVAVAQGPNSPYVKPTEQNVLDGAYPIARPLYLYTPDAPAGTVKAFIDFALSDEGQRMVGEQEFAPVRK